MRSTHILLLCLWTLAACQPLDPSADCLDAADCPSAQACLRGQCVLAQPTDPDDPAPQGAPLDEGAPLPARCSGAVPPGRRDVVVNEVLAAVPLDADVNGDGLRDSAQDEFVELVNLSGAPLDLRGAALQKGEDDQSPRVGLQTPCLAPGEALVVFGGLREDAAPPSYPGAQVELAQVALRLPDGGGVVRLLDADGRALHALRYEAQRGASTTLAPERVYHERAEPHARLNAELPYSPGRCASGLPFASGCPAPALMPSACADAPAAAPGDLVLNEVLSAVPAEPWGDVNGDGEASATRDEFIEVASLRPYALRLEGLRLWKDDEVGHPLPDACLPPLGAWLVVAGEPEGGALPSHPGVVVGASSRVWSLRQGGGQIALRDAQGQTLWRERLPESPRGTSLTRAAPLDPRAPWVPHEALAGAWASPGRCASGAALSSGCADDPAWEPCAHAQPARQGEVLLHELLRGAAEEPAPVDFNRDGRAEWAGDGFVELWVAAKRPVLLDGLRLEVNGEPRHRLRGCAAAGAGLVFFGRLEDGAQEPPGAVWQPADLPWGFPLAGRLALVDERGAVWDEVSWGEDASAGRGRSLARDPEADPAAQGWAPHPGPRAASPGVCASGAPLSSGCDEP